MGASSCFLQGRTEQELAPMGRSYGRGDQRRNAQASASTTKTLAMTTPVRPYMLS